MYKHRKPYRIKKKKSILKSRLFRRVVLGLVFAGTLFYFFFLSPIFQVKEINISGNQKIKTEAIKEMIQTGSIFLADLDSVEKEISEKFPQIASVTLKRRFPDKIISVIEERKAVAVFCQTDICFLIDKEGVIFENISDKLGLIVAKPSLTELKGLGDKVLENNIISSVLTIESKLKYDFKITVEEVSAVSNERLNVKTSEGWEIYFDPAKDLDWQTTKLKAVLEQEISPERRKSLQYIELRFGNLASYK